ncbi:MAG: phage tail sheath family protein [Flavobacteriales bacterium]|nr:phage tail sheath family protein [Flavobacteriales bacterium]
MVYIEETTGGARPISGTPVSVVAFVGRALLGPVNEPKRVVNHAEYVRLFGGLDVACPMSYAVLHFFQNGGSEALVVREPSGDEPDGTLAQAKMATITAMNSLDGAAAFNILHLPRYAPEVSVPVPVLAEALRFCAQRGAMLLVDPPAEWRTANDAAEGAAPLRQALGGDGAAADAMIYFPGVMMADKQQEGRVREFPPGGCVAGVIARTDAKRGVWKAPAGIEVGLVGVRALACSLTDAEQGLFAISGVNAIRKMVPYGNIIWGARTLAGDNRLASEWKYIPVRRTGLHIQESLQRGLKWLVFEPNNEPTWAKVRMHAGSFMHALYSKGAFCGSTPKEAYFVKCDKENNPSIDIHSGTLLTIGFAPLRPAEFIVMHIRLHCGAQ